MHCPLQVLVAALTLLGSVPTGASAAPVLGEGGSGLSDTHSQNVHGYAPSAVQCPSERPKIRSGSTLSPEEQAWLPMRRNNTIAPIRSLLKRIAIPGFDSDAYLANVENDTTALPNIGIALSGGGYRAMLNGAGAFAAWDDRSPGSTDPGNLGGLLQSSTYLTSLSGSSWLVGSIFANNYSTVQDSMNSDTIWKFQNSVFMGPKGINGMSEYYANVLETVYEKANASFHTTITDYWARMLSHQLLKAPHGGPGITFSSITENPDFAQGNTPLPIVVADRNTPGKNPTSVDSTLFEINPWEYGSRDPWLNGFAPLKYAGSKFVDGSLPENESCIVGFDNVGFIMGTSSSFFNAINIFFKHSKGAGASSKGLSIPGVPSIASKALPTILGMLGKSHRDTADWSANPFKGWNSKDPNAKSDSQALVDAAEDSQQIPFHPLTTQQRKVDVIFAVDSDGDTKFWWPNGASMVKTYERAIKNTDNDSGFPYIPDQNTMINLGLNTKPVFFGCNATNTTGVSSPLIVFLPNSPYFTHSNISTLALSVEEAERDAIVENGWAIVTQANSTRDKQWPVCVGCAMLSRSFDRTKAPIPDACAKCFEQYCWDGTLDESTPADYEPELWGPEINTAETEMDSSSEATRSIRSAALAAISTVFRALLGQFLESLLMIMIALVVFGCACLFVVALIHGMVKRRKMSEYRPLK